MTTPTAALVEEAETHTTCDKCGAAIVKYSDFTGLLPTEDGMRSHTPLVCERTQELRRAEAERDELRATVTRLNRRAQTAEAGVRDNVEASKAAGKSMGRTLANAAADMYLRRAEKAEAERDAQHAEVLRLTGELEALATKTGDVAWREDAAVEVVKMRGRQIAELLKTIEELRAQVWGLICAGSNMAKAKRYYQGLWETLRDAGLKGDAQLSELTATRDLLTEENARLQERVATLELLLRGGK